MSQELEGGPLLLFLVVLVIIVNFPSPDRALIIPLQDLAVALASTTLENIRVVVVNCSGCNGMVPLEMRPCRHNVASTVLDSLDARTAALGVVLKIIPIDPGVLLAVIYVRDIAAPGEIGSKVLVTTDAVCGDGRVT